jgi:hypothetical protein
VVAAGADAAGTAGGLIFAVELLDCLEQLMARNSTTAITVPALMAGKYVLSQFSPSICLKLWFPLPCMRLFVAIFPSLGLHLEKWHEQGQRLIC